MSEKKIEHFNIADKSIFLKLLTQRRRETTASINLIPFEEISCWRFDEQDGNLKHSTNGFFKIQSIETNKTIQPIINQAEHGILGLIIKEINGTVYCLVQMKIEPGNKDIIQISPTVQATESNYKGLHKGNKVKYIDYFIKENSNTKLLYKQLQSEQGSKFYKKCNWNVIIQLEDEELEVSDNHFWLSLSLINELIKENNIINMDLRSILSCYQLPLLTEQQNNANIAWSKSLFVDEYNEQNLLNVRRKLAYYKKKKHVPELKSLLVALNNGWTIDQYEIINPLNKEFIVKFIEVQIHNREVTSWSQPIISSENKKVNYFYVKKINGRYHYLVRFCNEIGLTTYAEIGPTLHNIGEAELKDEPYANLMSDGKTLFEALLSEEGGRFYHEENLYKIIELPEYLNVEFLPNYEWATLYSLKQLLRDACNINIEARTLISVFDWRLVGYEEN